jgi:hypothetical protein
MKKLVMALTGLVVLSSCVFAPGDKTCDCKHPKMHQGPKKGMMKPGQFKGPKKISEMKKHHG